MRRYHWVTLLLIAATAQFFVVGDVAAQRTPQAKTPPGQGNVLVGAASRSVLPLVDGSLDYLEAGFPGREDPYNPGIPVPEWDDGRIAVGNGKSESYWVHDDLRATAVAIQDPRSKKIVVIVDSDLYMIFRMDADQMREQAAALLPPGLADKLRVIVTASHNHHGPDTAFDVNHDWYDYMSGQVVEAIVEAVATRRPARLRVAAGEHWFGMNDGTDPQIFDPNLNVMQAVDTRGKTIATLVQWNLHPEATLNWSPPLEAIEEDCEVLGLADDDCDAEGRYFTADFPGILRQDLQAAYGGEALFLNGALGVLIGPGGSDVWEVTDDHPLGNQLAAPAGAEAPGGGDNYRQRNFRRAVIIGEQLAAAAMRLLESAEAITEPRLSYARESFYTYLSNFGFRVLLVVDPATRRTNLGHIPPLLYNCPLQGPKTDATCEGDDFDAVLDTNVNLPARVGDHLKSAVEYVRIGPVGMMFLPGEIPGELTMGLPAAFRSTPEDWYEEPPGRHAFGDEYQIPGYTRRRMSDDFKWTIGLGSDQLGYFIPLSNFRVYCVLGPEICGILYSAGLIEYPDSVAGATCKLITEDPSMLPPDPDAAAAIAGSCAYGQALGEAQGHYEETNAAGWDLVEDMMNAVRDITGNPDPTEVNPEFPGWWQGLLPPGDLPEERSADASHPGASRALRSAGAPPVVVAGGARRNDGDLHQCPGHRQRLDLDRRLGRQPAGLLAEIAAEGGHQAGEVDHAPPAGIRHQIDVHPDDIGQCIPGRVQFLLHPAEHTARLGRGITKPRRRPGRCRGVGSAGQHATHEQDFRLCGYADAGRYRLAGFIAAHETVGVRLQRRNEQADQGDHGKASLHGCSPGVVPARGTGPVSLPRRVLRCVTDNLAAERPPASSP
jgi:hypothetical protein